ncbi:MAG: divergent polysaccharide deacetylase family protein, partial [Alphaproteobacteria bacterium]|nr:divergent polysaccharide deacetylase family protein [Alphaproteobacteria bacterium]
MRDDEDDDDAPKGPSAFSRGVAYLVARPLLAGFVCAVIAFIALAALVPHRAGMSGMSFPVPAVQVVQESAPTPEAKQEKAAEGVLPEKAVDEMKAVPPGQSAEAPKPAASTPVVADVAVLVTDVGLSRRVAEAIDKSLPLETSLAVSVYASDPAAIARAFKGSERDVWVNLSCQSIQPGIDPGPLAMAGGLSKKENQDLLQKQVELVGDSAIGIFLPDDADLPLQSDLWRDIALEAIADNMMVLDATKTKVATQLYIQKSESKISAYLKTDLVIRGDVAPPEFQKALEAALPTIINLEQSIVVIKNPSVVTIAALSKWIDGLAG